MKKQFKITFYAALLTLLSGCIKKDCDIKSYHLHRFEKEGLVRYLYCEEQEYNDYHKTEQIEYSKVEESYFHYLEMREDLLKIEDNELYLKELQKLNKDDTILYRGYKIDNTRLVASPWVEDIFTIQEEYPYFKENELGFDKDSKENINKFINRK